MDSIKPNFSKDQKVIWINPSASNKVILINNAIEDND